MSHLILIQALIITDVITSYSIHYTKLYEDLLGKAIKVTVPKADRWEITDRAIKDKDLREDHVLAVQTDHRGEAVTAVKVIIQDPRICKDPVVIITEALKMPVRMMMMTSRATAIVLREQKKVQQEA